MTDAKSTAIEDLRNPIAERAWLREVNAELLEALEDLLRQYMEADGSLRLDQGPLDTALADAAIAKARGTGE